MERSFDLPELQLVQIIEGMWADMAKRYSINSPFSNRFQAGDEYGDKKPSWSFTPNKDRLKNQCPIHYFQ